MRKGFLAALPVLLAVHGLAFAQQDGSNSLAAVDAQAETISFWGSGEYLLWWFKNGRIPPLVTAGGNGNLGSPGTQIVLDNLNFDDDVRQGGRFALGYQFATIPAIGIEINYFYLAARQSDVHFSSDGDPVLAQPFLNVNTGAPDASVVAMTGSSLGSVTIAAQTGLWGGEANLAAALVSSDGFHLAALGGFRFLNLEDEITSSERIKAFFPAAAAGTTIGIRDDFRTVNRFYGGQVGVETGMQLGRLTIDFCGKVALGVMHQTADVNGVTIIVSPNGSTTTTLEGGVYALRSNIGRHQRDMLAFIPEAGLNIGLQLTRNWKVYAGYSLLWVSTVARAGEQIDPLVNATQIPLKSAVRPLAARPAFSFDGTDFWAQGLSFGLELRY